MPIEERDGWVYIQTNDPKRFMSVQELDRAGGVVKLGGRLKSSGKVATHAYKIPISLARVVFDEDHRKIVATMTKRVYDLLFEIRRNHKVAMRIRMV